MFISILKFTAVLLLVILITLLVLIILVLFVPFRYKFDGSFIDEVMDGTVSISWLMHFASVDLSYNKGILITGHIKLMGICIYRIEGENSEGDAA